MKTNSSYISLVSFGLSALVVIVFLFVKTLSLLTAKTIYFCQQFIKSTMFMVPSSLPKILIGALWTVFFLGIISFIFQLIKTNLLLKKILGKKIRLTKRLLKIGSAFDIDNKIVLVKDKNLYSFCFGLLTPRIVITTALAGSLTDRELEAVLLHEKAHFLNRDPLKILVSKTIVSTFFFLPIFRDLYKKVEAGNEIIADEFAIQTQGTSKFLRSALRKIIVKDESGFVPFPAIWQPNQIEIRIRKLKNSASKVGIRLSRTGAILSLLFVAVSLIILQMPVDQFNFGASETPKCHSKIFLTRE